MNPDTDVCCFDIPDPEMDVERMILHKLDMERLCMVLKMLPEEDRQFILDCFDSEWGLRREVAERYGMTIGAIKQRKRRVLKKITQMFFWKADSADNRL